jgi:hypothetical protein
MSIGASFFGTIGFLHEINHHHRNKEQDGLSLFFCLQAEHQAKSALL